MHHCNQCGKNQTEVGFGWRKVHGKKYPKHICNLCRRVYDRQFKTDPELLKAKVKRNSDKAQADRAAGVDRDKWILQDTRNGDRKRGMENDLTREFIRYIIVNPCTYCGENTIQMTLDRIDNNKGHIKSNVVGSCARCNFIRRDMPHMAWQELTSAVRKVREKGLFGDWTGQIHKRSLTSSKQAL
jgi:hypothetical protein